MGHAKQYIAYYNWTFGGQCGMGWYGRPLPAPYMADVDGYPVMDIYVDAVPPGDPQPRVGSVTPGSITFTWDPVADRGDGQGADYFSAGMGHYTFWSTINGRAAGSRRDSPTPLNLTIAATPADSVCVFIVAADKLGNATPPQSCWGLSWRRTRRCRPRLARWASESIPPRPAWPAFRRGSGSIRRRCR